MKRCLILSTVILMVLLIGCSQKVISQEGDNRIVEESIADKEACNGKEYLGEWVLNGELPYLLTGLQQALGMNSISIKNIEDNRVSILITSLTSAPSLRLAEAEFEGAFSDGEIKGNYEDTWENTGEVTLAISKDAIKATITRDPKEENEMWGIMEGEFTFVRPIETEYIPLASISKERKDKIEKKLSFFNEEFIEPFTQETLTDKQIINFMGMHIGSGNIQDEERIRNGEKGRVVFDKEFMEEMVEKYLKGKIKKHQAVGDDYILYEDGVYYVPAMGGVWGNSTIEGIFKVTNEEDLYYMIVNEEDMRAPFDEEEEAIVRGQYIFLLSDLENSIIIEKNKVENILPMKEVVKFL